MKKLQKIFIVLCVSMMLTGCIGNPYKTGVKCLEDGEYSEAIENFTEAIEKEKNLADSYRGLGIARWELGEYQEAYDAMEHALTKGTEENATIHSIMGNCAMQTGNYEKAAEHYEAALSKEEISDELKKETRYNLIAAYEYAGNVDKAKETVEEYIADYPDDEDVLREADFLETR